MNLGDGLLFELENGKPKLIVLSHAGVEKNPVKQLAFRPRAAKILSPRQPSCVEEVQVERPARQQAGKRRHARVKAGGAATSFTSSITADGGISTSLAVSKTRQHYTAGGGAKAEPKVKSDRHQQSSTVGSLKAGGKKGQLQTQGGGKERLKDTLANGDAGLKDSMVCLTSEQLQRILNTVQTSSNGQNPPADHRKQGTDRNEADSKSGSLVNDRGGGEIKEEDGGGGGEEIKKGGGVTDRAGTSQDKDNRSSGCVFSWLEERQSESRTAMDAKKAQWRRELSEQVALKQQQQRSAPGRLQAEDDAESVLSVKSSSSHREQPAAIRSSLRLGEFTPMEEVLSVERKEEQRRRWLEELDRQRDEMTERKRREKVLQNQTEDHELWATHFDSLHRRPPPVQTAAPSVPPAAPSVPLAALSVLPAAPSAPPAAPHCESERREWEPSSSLSLVWEATSSCGAESVGRASVDTTNGHPTKTSYLRTMTALLDPVQIEEREKRRLKQLEQQRAIEAQVEERRRQREQEEAKRREEEEEEERRVALEREMLQRQYEMDTLREKQKEEPSHEAEEPNEGQDYGNLQETQEPRAVSRQAECVEVKVSSPVFPLKDTAVQTEEAAPFQTSDVSAQNQPPPSLSAAPPNNRNRAGRTGKENICRPAAAGGGGGGRGRGGGGGDPYEEFARTERNRREKRRPEWNTQRPSRRFVPASERYPAALQRNRQENRLKRQAELLALQEKTRLPRTDPPAPNQEPRLCSNPSQTRTSSARRVESVSRRQGVSAAVYTERGRSPPVPAVRHTVQSQQASTSPPPLEFIPYVRTDEVFNLNPLDPADTPPPHIPTEAPQRSASPPPPSHRDPLLHPELLRNSHTHRQQEILRGLAQLRQGLLQKQRELETDLNPRLKRHDNKEEPSHEAEEPNEGQDYGNLQETQEPRVSRQAECVEVKVSSPVFPLKDTAVQTEEAAPFQTSDVSAQNQPPPSLSAAPPNNRNRAGRTGKENICRPAAAGGGGGGRGRGGGGGDPYEEFARTERNRREKRRPEWNTQRPSRRFVPASERYPAALQRNRQENRLKRQAELLALQEKTRLPRTDPPAPNQEPRLCSNPSQTRTSSARRVESVSRRQGVSAAVYTERGRSPPVPAVRHTVQSQQASTSPPPLEFIPYVRTDEVFNLNPLDPADTPPPHIPTEAPQRSASPPPPSHRDPLLHPELLRNSHTHRQQEILRGLAQLRQGLLQKQRELETDLNPRLKRHDNKLRSPSTTHHM